MNQMFNHASKQKSSNKLYREKRGIWRSLSKNCKKNHLLLMRKFDSQAFNDASVKFLFLN